MLDKISKIFANKSTKSIERFSFYNSNINEVNEIKEHSMNEKTPKRSIDFTESNPEDNLVVPEEFIDSITNEVMIDPILLPSGHSIDRTTLDKYLSEEAKWLRPPSDPFTQLLFTSERHPKPNYILRQRIDSFLSQHCEKINDERLESSKKRRIVGSNCFNNEALVSSKLVATGVPDTTRALQTETANAKQLCVECLRSHPISENSVLYKLLCNHLICRQKLTQNVDRNLKSISCKLCKSETPTERVIKLNRI